MPFDVKNPTFLNSVKVLLIEIREQQGLTQKDVFKKTGFHVGRMESTDWDMRLSSFLQLCELYHVKPSQLFEEMERREHSRPH